MQFWLLTLITQLRKIISERWRPSCRTHVRSSASHLLTFLVAQLQFLREWKLSDRRLHEVFELDFWFEVTPKKEIAGRYTHFKNTRSFCATLYILPTLNNTYFIVQKHTVLCLFTTKTNNLYLHYIRTTSRKVAGSTADGVITHFSLT